MIIFAGMLFGGIAGGYFALIKDLPQIRSLENFNPSASTKIYASDNVLLDEIYLEKRTPVPFDKIPSDLKTAIIATEDRKFYTHSGIDIKGIARAVIKDLMAGKFVEGASTITQQLAKTLFLSPRKTIKRKIEEAILAFQLERRYTKDAILALYLNQVYFGSGAYGVESAAQLFFGKPAAMLNLSQCALIAALPKSPSRYSPLVNKKLALKRRNIVLKQMLDIGAISKATYEQAVSEPVFSAPVKKRKRKAPYFIEYIKTDLEEHFGPDLLYKGGFTIYTTLSYNLQRSAEIALKEGLAHLKNRMTENSINTSVLQGALICIDVRTGGILAMVGGENFERSRFNRTTLAKRQSGSAFKPIVYALAITKGLPQNHTLLDAPLVFSGISDDKDWQPENYSNKYLGEITMRKALTHSQNTPAIRLTEQLGPLSVVQFAHKLGIRSNLEPVLPIALGASGTTLMEITAAYMVFPNRGNWIHPFGVLEVYDRKDRLIQRAKPQKTIAMAREDAAVMVNMLQGVINEGTAQKAKTIKQPVAGKTGTTNGFKDALFIGFSPRIATGVWVGNDDNTSLGKGESGSQAALPIWIDFMEEALQKMPYAYFDIPDNTVMVKIDPTSGARLNQDHGRGVNALFKASQTP